MDAFINYIRGSYIEAEAIAETPNLHIIMCNFGEFAAYTQPYIQHICSVYF